MLGAIVGGVTVAYTVGEVAQLAHVSVRALHHYDEIGLLRPSNRSGAGYRLYTDADVRLLQETLFLRELGFELADNEAYQESERRAVHYTADDWLRIEAEAEAVYEKLLDAFDDELTPDSELAQDAVQSWWDQIDRNFYAMSLDLLADLGEMYVYRSAVRQALRRHQA